MRTQMLDWVFNGTIGYIRNVDHSIVHPCDPFTDASHSFDAMLWSTTAVMHFKHHQTQLSAAGHHRWRHFVSAAFSLTLPCRSIPLPRMLLVY